MSDKIIRSVLYLLVHDTYFVVDAFRPILRYRVMYTALRRFSDKAVHQW